MKEYLFVVIGVGGTGSLLARDLPKLLIGTKSKICLIDGDVVEKKNIVRQGYQEQDVGLNKALSLSKKINSLYRSDCIFIDEYVTEKSLMQLIKRNSHLIPVLLGCVDNNATRIILETVFSKRKKCIYIDSANSEYEGNIYVAFTDKKGKQGKLRSECYKFDMDKHPLEVSCQEQVANGNVQFLVTNARMAVLMLEHCNALLFGELKEGVQVANGFETIFY